MFTLEKLINSEKKEDVTNSDVKMKSFQPFIMLAIERGWIQAVRFFLEFLRPIASHSEEAQGAGPMRWGVGFLDMLTAEVIGASIASSKAGRILNSKPSDTVGV